MSGLGVKKWIFLNLFIQICFYNSVGVRLMPPKTEVYPFFLFVLNSFN